MLNRPPWCYIPYDTSPFLSALRPIDGPARLWLRKHRLSRSPGAACQRRIIHIMLTTGFNEIRGLACFALPRETRAILLPTSQLGKSLRNNRLWALMRRSPERLSDEFFRQFLFSLRVEVFQLVALGIVRPRYGQVERNFASLIGYMVKRAAACAQIEIGGYPWCFYSLE